MIKITTYLVALAILFLAQQIIAQTDSQTDITVLEQQKEQIINQEKEALKYEVEEINKRLENAEITAEEVVELKKKAAEKRALNIADRTAIIDSKIALIARNGLGVLELDTLGYVSRIELGFGGEDSKTNRLFGIKLEKNSNRGDVKYDRRTYSNLIVAAGFNNAIISGQSLEDTPYEVGGSRFFEIGWQWQTRVFNNTNWLRFNYGFAFQFNGLKPKNNNYFVSNASGETVLEEFSLPLNKSKLRIDNLVFPMHLEFGPSTLKQTDEKIRYSLKNKFRLGIGGYAGINLGTRQKLKYERDGDRVKDKLKRNYNTSDFVYGLSTYTGFDSVLLYLKYDLNPIFQDAAVAQRNISLGLRFDL